MRLLAGRWAPGGHLIRDYLTRNQVPYAWLDPTEDAEGRKLAASLEHGRARRPGDPADPVRRRVDRCATRRPARSPRRSGLQTKAALPFYDVVIVGGGPAGLAAAVYGASEGLKTILVEQEAPGGQAGTTSRIENYLGFPAGLSGGDLARRGLAQARRLGAEILSPDEVTGIRREDPYRVVTLAAAGDVSCQTVVVATGVSYRQLDVPGAAELAGAGIYYGAATTEAVLYRDQEVGVVGGGNSAGQAAVYLSRFAKRVLLMVRTPELSGMSQYLIDQIAAMPEHRGARTRQRSTAAHGEGHLGCGHASPARAARKSCRWRRSSSSSASSRAPTGWRGPWCAIRAASCSPARSCSRTASAPPDGASTASRSCSNRACPASSWRATCGIGPSSGSPARSARAPWRCSSCTSTWPGC